MRKVDSPQGRVEAATRLKYTVEGLPAITPRLKKMGLHAWCTTSDPDDDCTGYARFSRGNGRIRNLVKGSKTYKADLEHNMGVIYQRRILQKIALELWEHYLELPTQDIGFLLGYSPSAVRSILDWEPPEGY